MVLLVIVSVVIVAFALLYWLNATFRTIINSIFQNPTKSTVVITIDGVTTRYTGVSKEQKEELINMYIRRHLKENENE